MEIRGCCWTSTRNKCNGKRSNNTYISYILNTYPQNYECEFICRSRKINYLFWNWSWKPYLLNINKISRVPIRQCSTVEIVKLIPNFCAVCPFWDTEIINITSFTPNCRRRQVERKRYILWNIVSPCSYQRRPNLTNWGVTTSSFYGQIFNDTCAERYLKR